MNAPRLLLLAVLLLPQEGLSGLIDALGGEGLEERAKAETELFRRGRVAIEPLEKAGQVHRDPEVRARARALLSRISTAVWGRIAVVADQRLVLVDPRTLETRTLRSSGATVTAAAWTRSGNALMLRGKLWEGTEKRRVDTGLVNVDALIGDDLLEALARGEEGACYFPHDLPVRELYSPDGTRALVAGVDPEVKVIDVATGRESASHRIEMAWKSHEGAWSTDGRTVAFTASRKQEGKDSVYVNLYLADPEFKAVRQCGDGISCMTWSPDSREILGTAGRWPPGEPTKLVLLDGKTGKRVVLAEDALAGEIPRFSPDGKRIAYVRLKDLAAEVVVMGRDGSGVRDVGPGREVQWSPDGSTVAYLNHGLCLTDLSTGATRRGPMAASFDWTGPTK